MRTSDLKFIFLLLILLHLSDRITPLTISEINFRTHHSKYYNQAIEIINTTSRTIKLTDFYLVAQNSSDTRTNYLRSWTRSEQSKLTPLKTIFDEFLLPNQIVVILDPGYITKTIKENYHLDQVKTLTISTMSLGGSRSFIKKNDVFFLRNQNHHLVDTFHLIPSTTGFSVNRINLDESAIKQNLVLQIPTIGTIASNNHYTQRPGTHLTLETIPIKSTIVGLPQTYFIRCKNHALISSSCEPNISLSRLPEIKLLIFNSKNNLILLRDKPLELTKGQSPPIVGYSLQTGEFQIKTSSDFFDPIVFRVEDFDHPQAREVYFNEIYYHLNKKLTWVEIYFKKPIHQEIKIQNYNSYFQLKDEFNLSKRTYTDWSVFAYRNDQFDQNLWSDQVTDLGKTLNLTAKGMLVVSSQGKILDLIHYDKNWFKGGTNHSLQRISLPQHAFTRTQWSISHDHPLTPFRAIPSAREYHYSVELFDSQLKFREEKISIRATFPMNGQLMVYLQNSYGEEIGLIFSQTVKRQWQTTYSICLKKANLKNGLYQLKFIYQTDQSVIESIQSLFIER